MLLPSARSPSLIHSITPHFLRSPSSSLALWLSVSRLHTVLASHTAFLFPRWWKIIFRNGLRCWQSKVIWFMSRQQLDYDGMVTPRTHSPLSLFTSSIHLTHFHSLIPSVSCGRGDGTGAASCTQANHIDWCEYINACIAHAGVRSYFTAQQANVSQYAEWSRTRHFIHKNFKKWKYWLFT